MLLSKALPLILCLIAICEAQTKAPKKARKRRKSMYDLIKADENLQTFAFVVDQGPLKGTFSKRGFLKYTVFAPSDAAFEEVGGFGFLLGADPEEIGQIFSYHVLLQSLPESRFKDDSTYGSVLDKKRVRINQYDGSNYVNGVKLGRKGMVGSNGIIHVVDKLLTIPEGTILDMGKADPDFSTLVKLVEAAGMAETLGKARGSLTLFAPRNDAFTAKYGGDAGVQQLMADKAAVKKLVSRHVLPVTLFSAGVKSSKGEDRETLDGQTVITRMGTISGRRRRRRNVMQMEAMQNEGESINVIEKDLVATNGVVHIIDKVL